MMIKEKLVIKTFCEDEALRLKKAKKKTLSIVRKAVGK